MRWCGRCWARREIGVFNELDARRQAQSNVDVGGRSRPLVEHLKLHVRRKSQSLGPAVELVAIMLVPHRRAAFQASRSEEHTTALQSLMLISYAVFCMKKKHTSNNKI